MTDNSGKWLTATDCAARTGFTVRALRVYEREGLLKPSRAANGWRRYGPDDLLRLNTISVLKALGLTLAQIRKLLRETNPSLLSVLQVQAKSWRDRHGEAAKALELVEAAIHRLERNQPPSLEELCQLVNTLRLAAGGELLAARRQLVSGLGLTSASLTIGSRRMPSRHPGTRGAPAPRDSPRARTARRHRWRHRSLRRRQRQP